MGHVGYYCAGMNKRATVRVRGNAGVGLAEDMISAPGDRRRQREPERRGATGRGGAARRPRGGCCPLRYLHEGRRYRRVAARIGHIERVMAQRGLVSSCAVTPATRSATRSTRLGCSSAARGRRPGFGLRREGAARRARSTARGAAHAGLGSTTSIRQGFAGTGPPRQALQLPYRQRERLLMATTDIPTRGPRMPGRGRLWQPDC